MEEKIQSIERAFKILESFPRYPNGIGLTELAHEVGLHKSTVHRFLNTLLALGYIEQYENNKYNLTYKMYNVGSSKLQHLDLLHVSQNEIEFLSKKVNEVVHLVIQDGIYVVYINKIEADNPITMGSKIGRRGPLVNTSVGKAILSNMTNEEIYSIFNNSIKSNLIPKDSSFDKFIAEIEETRRTKIALDDEENEDGICCVGTTIYGLNGKIEGAISVTGPTERMKDKMKYGLKNDLLRSAEIISAQMGFVFN